MGDFSLGSLKQQLAKLFEESLKATVPEELNSKKPVVVSCKPRFGDYQCNNAMILWAKLKGTKTEFEGPYAVGQAIMRNLPKSEMIESCSVAAAGFVNVVLSDKWIAKSIQEMLEKGIEIWAPKLGVTRAVVDFSSPNIPKQMHVGHLRSTVIGDSLARMLEYSNVEVLRRNHVGDWGTQFGMLIEYLMHHYPNWENTEKLEFGKLQEIYRKSKMTFDSIQDFKEKAQQAVIRLQRGEAIYLKAWEQISEMSRKELDKIYKRLGVHLEEKAESFYHPLVPGVVEALRNQGLIVENKGAGVIFSKEKTRPLIVVKSDGGYNYASTDLTALWYRLNEEKAEWIIYVTDAGQSFHFESVFRAARLAGWLPTDKTSYPKTNHVGFGLVLEDRRPIHTRFGGAVRLVDLLDKAKKRSKRVLKTRGYKWARGELERTAEALGYGAIKYADLKNNMLTNYEFSYARMLSFRGNTAGYLLYAHARICSIIRKSGKDIEELKKRGSIVLDHAEERNLALQLLQFAETVENACTNLLPNLLCDYLYNLAGNVTKFYSICKVIGSAEETSRLLLCEATAVVMRKCFHLLGMTPVYKM